MSRERGIDAQYQLRDLKLEVTHRCCLQCLHCSSEAGPGARPEMAIADAVRIVRQASDMGVSTLAISGGEPTIWDGILTLLRAVAESEMQLSLYSSGVGDQALSVIQAMASIPRACLIFSLYSHQPETHDYVTQGHGSHSTTVAAITSSVSLRVRTELHFTAMRLNYRDLLDVCRMAKALGVSKVSVLRLVPQGRSRNATDGRFLRNEDNLRLREILGEARSIIDTRIGSPYGFLHISDSPECRAGVDRLVILPDLRISPCDAFKQVKAEELAGTDAYSQLDRWSLVDCWERSPYLNAIRQHLREPHVLPCIECATFHRCFSGCTAQRYLTHGTLVRGPDPMCLGPDIDSGHSQVCLPLGKSGA